MIDVDTFEKRTGIRFTRNHTGKMRGMWSLGTSSKYNPICQARAQDPESICHDCYAEEMQNNGMYRALKEKLRQNGELLKEIIPVEEMPLLNLQVMRFESFGDLFCYEQVVNYFNLCKANPEIRFALWTKNPGFIDMAIKRGYEKPANLIIVLSSCHKNSAFDPERIKRVFPFVDKIFTVYTREYAEANGIEINCGARSCLACQRCYRKTDEVEMISEMLKADQKPARKSKSKKK